MSTPQELLSQAHPVEVDRITKKGQISVKR